MVLSWWSHSRLFLLATCSNLLSLLLPPPPPFSELNSITAPRHTAYFCFALFSSVLVLLSAWLGGESGVVGCGGGRAAVVELNYHWASFYWPFLPPSYTSPLSLLIVVCYAHSLFSPQNLSQIKQA